MNGRHPRLMKGNEVRRRPGRLVATTLFMKRSLHLIHLKPQERLLSGGQAVPGIPEVPAAREAAEASVIQEIRKPSKSMS